MTDRELLELAAKAAGVKNLYWAVDDPECDWVQSRSPQLPNYNVLEKWTWKTWDPLTDDGDALRLAVKLQIDVLQNPISKTVCCCGTDEQECEVFEEYGTDPYAATRRAIVRAAAEIGKGME